MLRITIRRDPATAAEYFAAEDYYLESESGGAPRELYGSGTEALGLTADFDEAQLRGWLEGKFGKLEAERGEKSTAAYDFTFSAPKSISVEALVLGDEAVRRAHQEAVRETMALFEAELCATRVTVGGERREVRQGGMIAVGVEHHTSRDQDPQLHTHVLVMASVYVDDLKEGGKLRALHSAGFIPGSGGAEVQIPPLLGRIYQSILAQKAQALGLETKSVGNGQFELEHYSEEVLAEFSKRRKAMNNLDKEGRGDELRALGMSEADVQEVLALETRQKKSSIARERLGMNWRAAAENMELKPAPRKPLGGGDNHGGQATTALIDEEIALGIEALGQRRAVFKEGALFRFVLDRNVGRISFDALRARLDALKAGARWELEDEKLRFVVERLGGQLLKIGEGTLFEQKVAASAQLRVEERLVNAVLTQTTGSATLSRDQVEALEGFERLGQAQQRAVRFLLSGQGARVGLSGVQGYAGTGKSTMLKVYKAGLDEAGKTVKVFAPSHQALGGLIEKGFEGVTIQKLLASQDTAQLKRLGFAADVWIVDESSMLSTKEMNRLVALSKAVGADLRLVGDVEQLAAVNAGSPFAQMQRAGMPTVALDEIMRQRHGTQTLQQAVDDAAKIASTRAVKTLLDDKQITEVKTKGQRNVYQAMAKRAMALRSPSGEFPLVLFPSHRSRGRFHFYLRGMLKKQGAISDKGTVYQCRTLRSMTAAEQRDYRSFRPQLRGEGGQKKGLLIQSGRREGWKLDGISPMAVLEVVGIDDKEKKVLVVNEGQASVETPKKLDAAAFDRAIIFERHEREFCVGEHVLFHEHLRDSENKITVGKNSVGVVEEILKASGAMRVRVNDTSFMLTQDQVEGLGYGYSATNHAMQGASREHVLVGMTSKDRQLITHEAFYVAISRAEKNLEVFTDNKTKLTNWTEKSGAQVNTHDEVGLAKTHKKVVERATLSAFFGSMPTLNFASMKASTTATSNPNHRGKAPLEPDLAVELGHLLVAREDLRRLKRLAPEFTSDAFGSEHAAHFTTALERSRQFFTKLSDFDRAAKVVLPALKELHRHVETLDRIHDRSVLEVALKSSVEDIHELGVEYLEREIAVREDKLGPRLVSELERLEDRSARAMLKMSQELGDDGRVSKSYSNRLGYNIDLIDALVRREGEAQGRVTSPTLRDLVAGDLANFQTQRAEILEHADRRGLDLEEVERAVLRQDGPLLSRIGVDIRWRQERLDVLKARSRAALQNEFSNEEVEKGRAALPHPQEIRKGSVEPKRNDVPRR